jgi:hypothetical protein
MRDASLSFSMTIAESAIAAQFPRGEARLELDSGIKKGLKRSVLTGLNLHPA